QPVRLVVDRGPQDDPGVLAVRGDEGRDMRLEAHRRVGRRKIEARRGTGAEQPLRMPYLLRIRPPREIRLPGVAEALALQPLEPVVRQCEIPLAGREAVSAGGRGG